MTRICAFVFAIFAAATAVAADLGKFNEWNDSPQGYFMTKAEHEAWLKLTSEAEAETFVADFLARRDAAFIKEVQERATQADKYLTVAKTPGSKSIRGKIVILFGPPSSMDVSVKPVRAGGRSGSVDMSVAASGGGTGPGMGDVATVSERQAMSVTSGHRNYTFTYSGDRLPTGKELTITVEVDMASGKERIPDKKAAAKLEEVFESAARASLKQATP